MSMRNVTAHYFVSTESARFCFERKCSIFQKKCSIFFKKNKQKVLDFREKVIDFSQKIEQKVLDFGGVLTHFEAIQFEKG